MKTKEQYLAIAAEQLKNDAKMGDALKVLGSEWYNDHVESTAYKLAKADAKDEFLSMYIAEYNRYLDILETWVAGLQESAAPFIGKKVYHKTTGVDKKFAEAIGKPDVLDKPHNVFYLEHKSYSKASICFSFRADLWLSVPVKTRRSDSIRSAIDFHSWDTLMLDENGKLLSIGEYKNNSRFDSVLAAEAIAKHKEHLAQLSELKAAISNNVAKVPSSIQSLYDVDRNSYSRNL